LSLQATEYTDSDELLHTSVQHVSTLARHIWPQSAKGCGYWSP